MLKSEIEVGQTYYFVGSDSPTRKHLAGMPFKVVRKERVFRKQAYRRGKARTGTVKVLRFFNDDNIGARAEELEPLPAEGFYKCGNQDCGEWSRIEDLHVEPGNEQIHNVCPFCGHTAQVFDADKFLEATGGVLPEPLCVGCNKKASELPEYIEAAQECETTPEDYARNEEGTYNPANGHFLCTDCYIAQGMPTATGGWVAP